MPYQGWPFNKPLNPVAGLVASSLSDDFQKISVKSSSTNLGHRFNYKFSEPTDILIKLTSNIATAKTWYRLGYIANLLTDSPISNPVHRVDRLYQGQQYFSLAFTGFDHYFEFWPHTWITDYQIELWARKSLINFVLEDSGDAGLLFFDVGIGNPTEQFTFAGQLINFP